MLTPRALPAVGLAALCVVAACKTNDAVVIQDKFNAVGYARLTGTVSHADGSAYATLSLFYSCGATKPGTFAGEGATDSQGSFDIPVDAPDGTLVAPSSLICSVSAPGNAPPVARAQATVAFSQSSANRPTTQFTLVEGQLAP